MKLADKHIHLYNLHGKEKVKLFPEFTQLSNRKKKSVTPNVLITSPPSNMYKEQC